MKKIIYPLMGIIIGILLMCSFNVNADNIKVVPYNPQWPEIYEKEAAPIKKALENNCLAIHHFGSTSVPGLSAKPKIDILAVVKSFSLIDIPALEKLGFEYRGEIIPTGRYLSKETPKVHLHIFEEGATAHKLEALHDKLLLKRIGRFR